jgi:hypothetical protein
MLVDQPSLSTLVPLIIVFTKYDELVLREEMDFDESRRQGLSKEEISDHVRGKTTMAFTEECIAPLKTRLESQIPPYKEVSSECACYSFLSLS